MNRSATSPGSVLIVEDHKDAAAILCDVVDKAFDHPHVRVAHTFREGMEYLRGEVFGIALLDLGLPDGNGLDLVRYASTHLASTLCIVTTIFDDEEHLFDALKFGASGYLLKGHSAEELTSYLVDAIDGRPALSPRIAQSMLGFFHQTDKHQSDVTDDSLDQLTPRELEVLSLIARGCGVREVGELLDISKNTVSHHIKSLYSKLNIHNRAEATAAAVQLNIFRPE